jgi:superfamily II DNA/RNA helicase
MTQPSSGRGRASSRRPARSGPSSALAYSSQRSGSSYGSGYSSEGQRAGGAGGGRPGGQRSATGQRGATGQVRPPRQPKIVTPKASVKAASALDVALAEALRRTYPPVGTFAELGLPPLLVAALDKRGIREPFAIQTRALPDALAGRDVLGRAQTGSGKTLAFGLPALTRLATRASARTPHSPRALVLVPTRELAQQVSTALSPLAEALGLRVTSVVGGAPYGRQIDALTRGVDVLVATPGRLIDLIERRACRLDRIEITVLDEADYMADLGFLPAVTKLLQMTPDGGQRLLFSATLDRGVAGLVETFLDNPVVHAVAPATASVAAMTHRVFTLHRDDKPTVAAEVAARPARTLFFVRTKHGADRLAKQLGRAGVDAAAIHGNLGQGARQKALAAFAAGSTRVLVATDVAARGIHVDGVDLVVHYDPPNDHKDYLHRSGRTARAGAQGMVVALIQPDELRAFQRLHSDARVEATLDAVHPGHPAVREVATSGDPIVVRAIAPVIQDGTGAPRSAGRRPYRGAGSGGPNRTRSGGPSSGRRSA